MATRPAAAQNSSANRFRAGTGNITRQTLAALNVLSTDKNLLQSRADLLKDISEIIQEHVSITDIAKKWQKQDKEPLLDWQLGWVKQLLQAHHVDAAIIIKENHALKTIEENVLSAKLWELYDHLLRQKQLVHTSVNPQMFLENMLLLWLQASDLQINH